MNPYLMAAEQAPQMLKRYGGPLGLAGKIIGLSSDEVESGLPWWAWAGCGAIAGGVLTYALRDKIERLTGN